MLHDAGATWLDENLEPIHLRNLRRHLEALVVERDAAQRQLEEANRRAEEAAAETRRVRCFYEAKPAIRLSKAFYREVDRLPAPAASTIRRVAGFIKEFIPPAR
jgi:hypothetical protein